MCSLSHGNTTDDRYIRSCLGGGNQNTQKAIAIAAIIYIHVYNLYQSQKLFLSHFLSFSKDFA